MMEYFPKIINDFNRSEAAVQWCSYEKVFWKYVVNLPENTHAELYWNRTYATLLKSHLCAYATLLKSHFGMGVLP